MSEDRGFAITGVAIGTFVAWIIFAWVFVYPIYNVWASEKRGQAELAQATFNRQIKVQEATATQDAAKALAEAEVTRAGGVAKANQIIGESLKNNETYLRYLWIQSLVEGRNDVIYVPTEANLPILEANRITHPDKGR